MKQTISQTRRGMVLIVALVTLGVAVALLTGWLQATMARHRQLKRRADQVQASWLCAAGLERAAAQLADDANYSGEVWPIAAELLDTRRAGEVTITVEPDPASPDRRQIAVSARYPIGEQGVKESQRILVDVTTSPELQLPQ